MTATFLVMSMSLAIETFLDSDGLDGPGVDLEEAGGHLGGHGEVRVVVGA